MKAKRSARYIRCLWKILKRWNFWKRFWVFRFWVGSFSFHQLFICRRERERECSQRRYVKSRILFFFLILLLLLNVPKALWRIDKLSQKSWNKSDFPYPFSNSNSVVIFKTGCKLWIGFSLYFSDEILWVYPFSNSNSVTEEWW